MIDRSKERKRFHYECPDGSFIGYTSDKECDPERMRNLYEYVLKPVEEITMKRLNKEDDEEKKIVLEIKKLISCVPKEYTPQDVPMIIKEVWFAKINERLPDSLKYLTNKQWVYYITLICDSKERDLNIDSVEMVFKELTNTWGNDCWR